MEDGNYRHQEDYGSCSGVGPQTGNLRIPDLGPEEEIKWSHQSNSSCETSNHELLIITNRRVVVQIEKQRCGHGVSYSYFSVPVRNLLPNFQMFRYPSPLIQAAIFAAVLVFVLFGATLVALYQNSTLLVVLGVVLFQSIWLLPCMWFGCWCFCQRTFVSLTFDHRIPSTIFSSLTHEIDSLDQGFALDIAIKEVTTASWRSNLIV